MPADLEELSNQEVVSWQIGSEVCNVKRMRKRKHYHSNNIAIEWIKITFFVKGIELLLSFIRNMFESHRFFTVSLLMITSLKYREIRQ